MTKCNQLTPLFFKGLNHLLMLYSVYILKPISCQVAAVFSLRFRVLFCLLSSSSLLLCLRAFYCFAPNLVFVRPSNFYFDFELSAGRLRRVDWGGLTTFDADCVTYCMTIEIDISSSAVAGRLHDACDSTVIQRFSRRGGSIWAQISDGRGRHPPTTVCARKLEWLPFRVVSKYPQHII